MIIKDLAHIQNNQVDTVFPPGTSFTFGDLEADLLTFDGRNAQLLGLCSLASCT